MTPLTVRRLIVRQRPNIILAIRGTSAALAALGVAVFLNLEYPYWAAMTALIVIQPTRGLLFEKSFYRLVGTAIGSAAGLVLLMHTRSPLVLTVAISLWIAACVGIGNQPYAPRSYAILEPNRGIAAPYGPTAAHTARPADPFNGSALLWRQGGSRCHT